MKRYYFKTCEMQQLRAKRKIIALNVLKALKNEGFNKEDLTEMLDEIFKEVSDAKD